MIYLFILGRILLGGFFIKSGYKHFKNLGAFTGYTQSKGVPMPKVAVIVTGLMLLLGGLGILLGVYTQYSVALLALFLVGVSFKMHDYWNDSDPMMKMNNNINFYKNLALLGAVLLLLFIPAPWAMSLVM